MPRSLRKQLFKKEKCHIGGKGSKMCQRSVTYYWNGPLNQWFVFCLSQKFAQNHKRTTNRHQNFQIMFFTVIHWSVFIYEMEEVFEKKILFTFKIAQREIFHVFKNNFLRMFFKKMYFETSLIFSFPSHFETKNNPLLIWLQLQLFFTSIFLPNIFFFLFILKTKRCQ